MKESDTDRVNLFVYGTLMEGESSDITVLTALLPEEVLFEGVDMVRGELLDLGEYPGAVNVTEDCPKVIYGEIYNISKKVLSLIDKYECYPRLFDRKEVVTRGGRNAWIYTYAPGYNPDKFDVIKGGDWGGDWRDRQVVFEEW